MVHDYSRHYDADENAVAAPAAAAAAQPTSMWDSFLQTWNALNRTKSVETIMQECAEDAAELDASNAAAAEAAAAAAAAHPNGDQSAVVNGAPAAGGGGGLAKVLTLADIVAYGVGSTVGAGIFVSTAPGVLSAGPAIPISFFIASLSCLFSAFAYSEFGTRVPVSGSAYTFTYVCLGELAAWFVGWNLTLEYCISAAAVARVWSTNLAYLFNHIGVGFPGWLNQVSISDSGSETVSILAALICLVCMCVLLLGVKESSRLNMSVTIMNISIILFIIIYGSVFIHTSNYTIDPNADSSLASSSSSSSSTGSAATMDSVVTGGARRHLLAADGSAANYFPNGLNGVLTGAAQVFFSYVGFDSVTTLAEEMRNPKRDLPIGILGTLGIASSLYVGSTAVLVGMMPWNEVSNDTPPLAAAFTVVGHPWASTLIAACTVTGLTTTVLTSLFGQPRIFYRMAKDGLLFEPFKYVSPKSRTPVWGTIISSVVAALICFFLSIDSLSNMISIGTLLAFTTVCIGVVLLRYQPITEEQRERYSDGLHNGAHPTRVDVGARAPLLGADSASAVAVWEYRARESHDQDMHDHAFPPSPPSEQQPQQQMREREQQHVQQQRSSFTPDQAELVHDDDPFWVRLEFATRPARAHPGFWMLLYVIACIVLSFALTNLDPTMYFVAGAAGLVAAALVVRMWYLPVNPYNYDPKLFMCPMVPLIPCLGVFTNVYLIASLDWLSYVRVLVWTVIGFTIYFFYGISHSTLGIRHRRDAAAAAAAAGGGPSTTRHTMMAHSQGSSKSLSAM